MSVTRTAAAGALRLTVEPDRDRVILVLEGELDARGVPVLAEQVGELRDVGFGALCIDVRGLSTLDGEGVAFLVALLEEQSEDFSLELRTWSRSRDPVRAHRRGVVPRRAFGEGRQRGLELPHHR